MKLYEARHEVIQIVANVLALCESKEQLKSFRDRRDNCAIADTITDRAIALRDKITAADKSCHTIKNWISKLRGLFAQLVRSNNFALREHDMRAMIMFFNRNFTMPESVAKGVEARANERRDERAMKCVEMSMDKAEHILGRIRGLADPVTIPAGGFVRGRDDGIAAAWAVYLGLITGRRPIEWETGNFHARTSTGISAFLKFSGQAKTRAGGVSGGPKPYDIPVLDSPISVINRTMELEAFGKRRFGQHHYEEVGRRIGWPLGKIDLMPNTMRAFYACVCCYKFKPGHFQDWKYIGSILGHTEDDMVTCQAYKRFNLS